MPSAFLNREYLWISLIPLTHPFVNEYDMGENKTLASIASDYIFTSSYWLVRCRAIYVFKFQLNGGNTAQAVFRIK